MRRALIGGALDNIRRNGPVRDTDPKTKADEADRAMQKAYPETRQAKPFAQCHRGRGGIKLGSPAAAELAARRALRLRLRRGCSKPMAWLMWIIS